MKANWRKQMMISALALTLSAANAAPVFASAAPDGKIKCNRDCTDNGNDSTVESLAERMGNFKE